MLHRADYKFFYMKYYILAFFATLTSFCFAQPDPWVSGTHGGYEYADLGLPSGTLWATHNIGATKPEEYGDFFAWGEIEPKDWFERGNYQYQTGEIIKDSRFGSWYECIDIGENISGTEYDAAVQLWGNGWRMPTREELYELTTRCWSNGIVERNGVKGRILCGPNENSIFIPAAGAGASPSAQYELPEGRTAALWIGNIYEYCFSSNGVRDTTYVPIRAECLVYDDGSYRGVSIGMRYTGKNIRPVYNPKEVAGLSSVSSNSKVSILFGNGKLSVLGLNNSSTVRITDMTGRTFQTIQLDRSASINVDLSCGFYIVSVSDATGTIATKKIIVKK